MRFIPCLLCASMFAPAAQANELMRVYEKAQLNDTVYEAARFARDAAIEVEPQARAALLPQVNGSYSYGKTNEEGSQTVFGSPTTTFDSKNTNDGLSLTLRQSIFSWERWKTLFRESERAALAETNYRIAGQSLVLRSAEAYFAVLSAADTLRAAEAEKTAVQRQLEQANKRFEVGLSAITDVQETQARYDLSVADVIEAQRALESARLRLAELTGTPDNRVSPLQDDFPLPAPDPANVESWVSASRNGSLDIMVARHNLDIAREGVGVAWARHLPTVDGNVQYGDSTFSNSFRSGDSKSTSYGVEVTVPIFSGFFTHSQVRAAKATRSQLEAELEGRNREVERATRDAYQSVLANAAKVKALKQAVVSNTTALEASETGLQVGARTSVDVLNAQQLLFDAQRTFYQSRYEYLLSVLRLKAAAGSLGAEDLAEIDRLLVGP